MEDQDLKKAVSEKYARAALDARTKKARCCEPTCCEGGKSAVDPSTRDLYSDREKGQVPKAAVSASLGCGNPTALAELRPGEAYKKLHEEIRKSMEGNRGKGGNTGV
jgi:hypothetical protein